MHYIVQQSRILPLDPLVSVPSGDINQDNLTDYPSCVTVRCFCPWLCARRAWVRRPLG